MPLSNFSFFSKRKARNLIISILNQNKTRNMKDFLEKEQNTQEQKSSYASILRKVSKISVKRPFKKASHLLKPTLPEKRKTTVRSRSKENNNQTQRERPSASINQDTDRKQQNL